jgi:hypothetical protein
LQYAFKDVCHIITMLYELSATVLRRPAPRDRLEKYAAIDVSCFLPFDIQHVAHMACATESLIDRLGRANTRRRQLLRYHEQHHDKIARYVDVDLETSFPKFLSKGSDPPVIPPRKPLVVSTDEASQFGCVPSQTTVTTYKGVEDTPDIVEVGSDTGQSQTSFASSLKSDVEGRLCVPKPPNPTKAFGGQPFECPYCYVIISVKGPRSWK